MRRFWKKGKRTMQPTNTQEAIMEITVQGRAGGKTHRLLKALEANPQGVLAVHSEREATRLRRYVADHEMKVAPSQIVAWRKTQEHIRQYGYKDLYLDNLDLFLIDALGGWPAQVSCSEPIKLVTIEPFEMPSPAILDCGHVDTGAGCETIGCPNVRIDPSCADVADLVAAVADTPGAEIVEAAFEFAIETADDIRDYGSGRYLVVPLEADRMTRHDAVRATRDASGDICYSHALDRIEL